MSVVPVGWLLHETLERQSGTVISPVRCFAVNLACRVHKYGLILTTDSSPMIGLPDGSERIFPDMYHNGQHHARVGICFVHARPISPLFCAEMVWGDFRRSMLAWSTKTFIVGGDVLCSDSCDDERSGDDERHRHHCR